MQQQRQYRPLAPIRGRRSSTESPWRVADDLAEECLNTDFYRGGVGQRRSGAAALTMTNSTLTGTVSHVSKHLPTGLDSAAELWVVDDAATPVMNKLAGGTSFSAITLTDNWTAADVEHIDAVTFNGKRWFAGNTAQDRLHVSRDGTNLKRAGIATPSAPTVADTGAGSYAATIRYYRVRMAVLSGSTRTYISEPSASQSFTPSGTGTAARVTKPTTVEDATHWILEGSADDELFYELSTIAVGTTTYDDSAAPSTYSANDESLDDGDYTVWTSVKYLCTDNNRLLGAGAWETGGSTSRVWFSALLGASGVGNDERVPTDNYVDLNEQDGGQITGLAKEPVFGYVWVFKRTQIWRLVATGVVSTPYRPINESRTIGCIANKSIVIAEDAAGAPAIYFLSDRGPYRMGSRGLEYLGRDVEDIWSTVNRAATSVVAHGVYHPDKHQVWWWVATGSSNDPDVRIVVDTELASPGDNDETRGGWVKHTGENCEARCSVMFANTVGASMSVDQKPYIGYTGSANTIWKCDTGTTDAGTNYQAYIQSAPFRLGQDGARRAQVYPPWVTCVAGGTNVTTSYIADYGVETRTGTAAQSFTAVGSETLVAKEVEGLEMADAETLAVKIGDASAQDASWTIENVLIPYEPRQPIGVRG